MSELWHTQALCNGKCDRCKDFSDCNPKGVIIICWGRCDTCKRTEVCTHRENAAKEGYVENTGKLTKTRRPHA